MSKTMSKQKVKTSSFKERYDNDPEFKAKHIKYMTEKKECDCGDMVARNNMIRHLQTRRHEQGVDEKQVRQKTMSMSAYKKMLKQIDEQKKKLKELLEEDEE